MAKKHVNTNRSADILERLEILRGNVRYLERNEIMAELDEIIKLVEDEDGNKKMSV